MQVLKPLLVAPWTPEDTDIWLRWAKRHGWRVYACFLANVQTTGDRRDAALMLGAARHPVSSSIYSADGNWIPYRGNVLMRGQR